MAIRWLLEGLAHSGFKGVASVPPVHPHFDRSAFWFGLWLCAVVFMGENVRRRAKAS